MVFFEGLLFNPSNSAGPTCDEVNTSSIEEVYVLDFDVCVADFDTAVVVFVLAADNFLIDTT